MTNQLTCKEFISFLDDYVADELEAGVRSEFERHLSACPDCVDYLKSYRDTIRLARLAHTDESTDALETAPPELINAILAARAKSPPQPPA